MFKINCSKLCHPMWFILVVSIDVSEVIWKISLFFGSVGHYWIGECNTDTLSKFYFNKVIVAVNKPMINDKILPQKCTLKYILIQI